VDQDDKIVAAMLAKKRAIKAGRTHNIGGLKGVNSTMKWPPFVSTFVVNKACGIIKSGPPNRRVYKFKIIFLVWKTCLGFDLDRNLEVHRAELRV
jgi:hypothetical protein